MEKLVKSLITQLERIDRLVNNAGIIRDAVLARIRIWSFPRPAWTHHLQPEDRLDQSARRVYRPAF